MSISKVSGPSPKGKPTESFPVVGALKAANELRKVIYSPTLKEQEAQKEKLPSFTKTQIATALVAVAAIVAVGLFLGHLYGIPHLPNFVHSHAFQLATEIGSPIGAVSSVVGSILITSKKRHAIALQAQKEEQITLQKEIESKAPAKQIYFSEDKNIFAHFPKGLKPEYEQLIREHIEYTRVTVSSISEDVMSKKQKAAAITDAIEETISKFGDDPYTVRVKFDGKSYLAASNQEGIQINEESTI